MRPPILHAVLLLLAIASVSCGLTNTRSAAEERVVGGVRFARIPAGEFLMGDEECRSGLNDDCPRHRVKVSSFWMGTCEITRAQYRALMPEKAQAARDDDLLPVNMVSWRDAMEYCARFSRAYGVKARLPYEAEWEYACRAGSATRYYWGDAIDGDYCWYYNNSGGRFGGKRTVHPVGQKRPNAFGLFDMSGNLWEWCMDWLDLAYYAKSPADNPKGPASGDLRVLRGGCWNEGKYYLRSAIRNGGDPGIADEFRGFRVVIEMQR